MTSLSDLETSIEQGQIEVHWQHPRTELELPLLLVWPSPVNDEWAAIVDRGVATVVCHEWLFKTDDGDINKRAEEWGTAEPIPGYVAEALLAYDGEYGPGNSVRNPTWDSDDAAVQADHDEYCESLEEWVAP
jgi:hypothetical protein